MKGFTAVDLTPQCEVRQSTEYEYEVLQKIEGATDLIATFSSQIWRNPEEFDVQFRAGSGLRFRWRASADTAGIASLRDSEQTLLISLLASGLNADADTITLGAFQTHVVRELHDTGFEPSFELVELRQRPLVATIGLAAPKGSDDRWLFALADRCFAAAYFRKLGLA